MTELRGLHLHVDGASGAAGDMLLGALIDLGVPLDVIGDALDAIEAGRERLRVERIVKRGIAAVDIKVDTAGHVLPAHGHRAPQQRKLDPFVAVKFRAEDKERHVVVDEHGDKHEHDHHHDHYHYGAIRKRILDAKLTAGTRERALDIFDRLARAEAKLHGTTVEAVAFHEVGAIDSIVDVVGTAAALDWLRPASVSCAAVAMGHGTLTSAHGVLPVPAPAALEVLRDAGGVMTDGGVARELCTPTGAAILAATVTSWAAAPAGRAVAVGWGAGDMDLHDRPNVVRVVASVPNEQPVAAVWQIDANLDDMSPELCGPAAEAIFAAGALDVWWTPITMKKGRPALTLSALVELGARDAVIAAILRETTTIGVRFAPRERVILARRTVEVETQFGTIAIKEALDGDRVLNAAPEFDSCAAAARRANAPTKVVYAAALAAYAAKQKH
jgi:uncharacterized protein (TIGR00299 family) protein